MLVVRCVVCAGAGMRGLKNVVEMRWVANAMVAAGSRETAPEDISSVHNHNILYLFLVVIIRYMYIFLVVVCILHEEGVG